MMQQQQQQTKNSRNKTNDSKLGESHEINSKKKRSRRDGEIVQPTPQNVLSLEPPVNDIINLVQDNIRPKRKKKVNREYLSKQDDVVMNTTDNIKSNHFVDINNVSTPGLANANRDTINKKSRNESIIQQKVLINELCVDPELKSILLRWSDRKQNYVIRKFTHVFIVAYKGNARTTNLEGRTNIEGKAINFGTHFTGEYSHCELVFASIEEKKHKKNITRDTFESIKQRGRNTNQPFYCAFRITTNTPVASFRIYKEMGCDWAYGEVNIERNQIMPVILWCARQKLENKPFDRTYFWFFAINSSLAYYRFINSKESDVGNWSLTRYICTTLTAMALSVAIPELEKLFDDSKTGLGVNRDLKIWHLYPGDLLNILTTLGLIKNDRNMFFGEIQV